MTCYFYDFFLGEGVACNFCIFICLLEGEWHVALFFLGGGGVTCNFRNTFLERGVDILLLWVAKNYFAMFRKAPEVGKIICIFL